MFATLLSAALFASSAVSGVVATLSIEAPASISQCGNAQIKWSDAGASAYSVLALNPEDPCGDAISDLGADHGGLSMTWYNVSLVAGTQVQFYVETDDDDGWSASVTVGDSEDFSCLPVELQPAAVPVPSSSAATSVDATTLVITPSASVTVSKTSAVASTTLVPVGAAGADSINANNGALGAQQLSIPFMALSAFVAAFALL